MKYKDSFYSYQNMCDLAANIYSRASSQASNYDEFLLAKHIEEQIRDSHEVPEEDVVDFAPLVAFNEEVAIFIDNYKEIEYQIVYMTKEGVESITNKASTLVEAVNSSIKDKQPNCILYAEKIDEAVDSIESILSAQGDIDLSVFDYKFKVIEIELDEIYSAIESDTHTITKGWENLLLHIYDNFIEPHAQERPVNQDFE